MQSMSGNFIRGTKAALRIRLLTSGPTFLFCKLFSYETSGNSETKPAFDELWISGLSVGRQALVVSGCSPVDRNLSVSANSFLEKKIGCNARRG